MSDAENDEGADFEALFMQHKSAQPLLSPARTQTRLTAERRAARTPKQREQLSEPARWSTSAQRQRPGPSSSTLPIISLGAIGQP